jgi:putative peptide zinc metalloprotease protein
VTIDKTCRGTDTRSRDSRAAQPDWLCLLPGTELLGQAAGSGLREAPYLVRRCDGQVVQLSRLLYVIASRMDGSDLAAIAASAGAELELRIGSDQVAYVAEQKLAPLGLVRYRDGRMPALEQRNALLALRFRAGLVPERAVNALAWLMQPLFVTPLVLATLVALVGFDVWLGASHGITAGLAAVIQSPALFLALFGVMLLSLAFHELGHAAACRYGGARPGRIGVGIYLVWPVFFTDVTDSYRLSKAGRLRTDLGGVYFNALLALVAAAAYAVTSYKPLVIVAISQQLMIIDQFVPWVRLDGYHIVSDLIGVSDLFSRIKPVIRNLVPGREPDPRVTELKRWARVAVTTWVLSTVAALTAMAALVVVNASTFLRRAWESLIAQAEVISHGGRVGSVVDVLVGAVGVLMLLLPLVGITFTYLLLCRGVGAALAVRRTRLDMNLVTREGEEVPQSPVAGLPTTSRRLGNACSQGARLRFRRVSAKRDSGVHPYPHPSPNRKETRHARADDQ